jgi:hypothetical protein
VGFADDAFDLDILATEFKNMGSVESEDTGSFEKNIVSSTYFL